MALFVLIANEFSHYRIAVQKILNSIIEEVIKTQFVTIYRTTSDILGDIFARISHP